MIHLLVAVPLLVLPSLAHAQGTNGAQAPVLQAPSRSWNPQEVLKTETFVRPPANVERMIMAPRTDISFTSPSPDGAWFLRTSGADRGDIMAYGKPHIYLAGVIVDTKANRARSLTTSTRRGLTVMNPTTGVTRTIGTPAGASISSPVWSPNGLRVAYIANFDDASYVYVASVASGKSARAANVPLLATIVTGIRFTADGRTIVAVVLPEGRSAAPVRGVNGVADGPQVRLTGGRALPQPVHFSLLEDAYDKTRLRYYTTGQLALIDVAGKGVRRIGGPRMIRAVEPSPDATHFLVTAMTEPFSYLVPAASFGSVQELWNASGARIATISTTPLRESGRGDDGGGSVGGSTSADTGKRNVAWNPAGAGLVYFESVFAPQTGSTRQTGARAGARAQPTSVKYVSWLPPFSATDTRTIHEGGAAFNTVMYSDDNSVMFVADSGTIVAIRVADRSKRFTLPARVSFASAGGFGGGGAAA